jgi:uncharacterized phage protein (TIGR02218 family)
VIEIVTPGCRVDLYSSDCGVDPNLHYNDGTVDAITDGSLGALADSMLFFDDTMTEADGTFNLGTVVWQTGLNAGRTSEVRAYFFDRGRIELWEPTPFPIQVGDTYKIYLGCNKTEKTCGDIFNNIVNHRGFPHVPGGDSIIKYPDAKA